MNALELKGLEKRYSDFCLGPLDLTLPGGTICGLIGENGAGKSTTLNAVAGVFTVDQCSGTAAASGCWDRRTAQPRSGLKPRWAWCWRAAVCRAL